MQSEKYSLDGYSLKILEQLQQDARQTVQQIADKVGLSSTPCWNRMKEMEQHGVIQGYSAIVDRKALGLDLMVMAEVNLNAHTEGSVTQFTKAVRASAQIIGCVSTTGQADYILTVMVRNIEEYDQFLMHTLFKIPGVTHVRSAVVLKEIKRQQTLPVA